MFDLRITYICAHCGGFAEVPFLEVEAFDSGTTLTCNRCGEDTIFGLDTPGKCVEWYEELKALQELLAVRDGEVVEMRQVIEILGDQSYRLDALTKAVADELRAERDEARAAVQKLEKIITSDTCCAYCGVAYPEGTPRFGGDVLTEHIKVCPEHPMRETEQHIKELERELEAISLEWVYRREK